MQEHSTPEPGDTLIGVLILGMPDGATSFSAGILRRAFEAQLKRDQVESFNWGNICLPAFAVVTFYASDRSAAFRSLQSVLVDLDLVKYSISAYFDQAEHYWRNVHRGFSGEFGYFVSPEVMREARARVETLSRVVEGLKSAVLRMGEAHQAKREKENDER